MSERLSVGVVGASGFVGGELCRLLLGHAAVEEILPTSRTAESFDRVHRNLLGSGLSFVDDEELRRRADTLDVVFFCTPAGEAMRSAPDFLARDTRVIDLSPDFRFTDPQLYEDVYGKPHAAPELLPEAVYGVTELYRDDVRAARLVANPGCYVITAILALAPLLGDDRIDLTRMVRVHAVNGTTGAGATPKREILHAEAANDMLPYSLDGHRHVPELEQRLSETAGRPVSVELNTAHGAFPRGIYLQASVEVLPEHRAGVDRSALIGSYLGRYGTRHDKEYFVLVNSFSKNGHLNAKEYAVYPSMASVVGSNFCHLGVDYDSAHGIVKVVAVTDNLVKGAAGSAIQNMNVMLDLDENEGISHYGM